MNDNLELRLYLNFNFSKPFKEAKKEFLRRYIKDLLILSWGNVSMAARKANLHRRHMYRIITDFDLDLDEPRKELLKPHEYMKDTISELFPTDELEDISRIIVESLESITYEDALALFEKKYIIETLKINEYDLAKTAVMIDISERTLQRKIEKYSIAI